MATHRATIEEARAAKGEAQRRLRGVSGVVGIGLTRQGEGYALKINLAEDRRSQIPEQVSGVPVVVEVVGRITKRG